MKIKLLKIICIGLGVLAILESSTIVAMLVYYNRPSDGNPTSTATLTTTPDITLPENSPAGDSEEYTNPQSVLIKDDIMLNGKKIDYKLPQGSHISSANISHKKDKIAVVISNFENGADDYITQLILMKTDGTDAKVIVKTQDALKSERKTIGYIGNAMFSNDDNTIYFSSNYGGPGTWVIAYNLMQQTIKEIAGGSLIDIAPAQIKSVDYKKFENFLFVAEHRYFATGGSYDYVYLINPLTGEEAKDFVLDSQDLKSGMGMIYEFFQQ